MASRKQSVQERNENVPELEAQDLNEVELGDEIKEGEEKHNLMQQMHCRGGWGCKETILLIYRMKITKRNKAEHGTKTADVE
jgi:hypothetical protein